MDIALSDQVIAFIADMAPQYPYWFAFDFGRYVVGAGIVSFVVNILLSRKLHNNTSVDLGAFRIPVSIFHPHAWLRGLSAFPSSNFQKHGWTLKL